MAREHHLRSSSSPRCWGTIASQRLPLGAVARSGSNIYLYHKPRQVNRHAADPREVRTRRA